MNWNQSADERGGARSGHEDRLVVTGREALWRGQTQAGVRSGGLTPPVRDNFLALKKRFIVGVTLGTL